MSTQVSFNDEDLKNAIKKHFQGQGDVPVIIPDDMLNQLVQDFKTKQKKHTIEEFKLLLSELKMELQPSVATVNIGMIVESDVKPIQNVFAALWREGGWGNATRNEISQLLAHLSSIARQNGKSIPEQRKLIEAEKSKLRHKIDALNSKVAEYNNFNENDKTSQEEMFNIIEQYPRLQELSAKEHEVLSGARIKHPSTGDSEAARMEYTPEDIALLNKIFVGKNSGKPEMMTFARSKGNGKQQIADRLLWTKKRFAFEKALDPERENSELYTKRLAYYQQYVGSKKAEASELKIQMNMLDRILLASRTKNQITERFNTKMSEHFHGGAGVKDEPMQQLDSIVSKYQMDLREELNLIKSAGAEYSESDKKIVEIEAKLDAFMDLENPEPVMSSRDELAFDPERIFELRAPHMPGAPTYQKATLPPNVWSVTQEGTISSQPLTGNEATWEQGYALYSKFDKPNKQSENAKHNIIRLENQPKVTQPINVNPYATEDQSQDAESAKQKNLAQPWDEATKRAVAGGPANWVLLWNLAKKSIDKEHPLNEGEDGYFKKHPAINSSAVRLQVISNKYTPDWIVMYVAEADKELQTKAINELGQRGWTLKTEKKEDPATGKIDKLPAVDSTGAWIWQRKGIKSSMQISFREAQMNPVQPMLDQLQGLENTQDATIKKNKEQFKAITNNIQQELIKQQQNQNKLPTGQQTQQTNKAPQNGMAIPGGIAPTTPSAHPMASSKGQKKFSWRA